MTLTVPPRGLLTASVLNTLKAALAPTAYVYDHRVPGVGETPPRLPYHILYSIAGGSYAGPELTAPDTDATFVYQLTTAGRRRDQVELLADMAADVIVGRTAAGAYRHTFDAVEGWVFAARMRADGPGGVDREGVPPNEVFSAANRFYIVLTPTG